MLLLASFFLSNFQFTLNRLTPFMYRAGELLHRERNLINPVDRAETQQLINQIGRALEEVARAAALSAHYYRDLTIGEAPGVFRVNNSPRDFEELNREYLDRQFANASSGQNIVSEPMTDSASNAQFVSQSVGS
jgi:hypothetical protein